MVTKLDQIRAREQAATPASTGAWRINDDPGERPFLFAVPTMDDIVFIGHSRADIPLLLAVAEAAADMEFAPIVRFQVDGDTIAVCGFCGARADSPEIVKHFPGCHWKLIMAAIAPLLEDTTID